MSDLVSIADGNLTAAATWALTASNLISNSTSTTNLTTGNLDSVAFTPGAITLSGMCVKFGQLTALTAAQTITFILRNSTDGTDLATVVVNKTALFLATAALGDTQQGGWLYLKFAANQTTTAGKNYVVRITTSNTSGTPSFCTNGTANNWQHMLVTTTTQAPTTGDDMHICGVLDGSANPVTAVGARTVNMDSTAATDYGSGQTGTAGSRIPALDINYGATLTWLNTTGNNYILRLSGWLRMYANSVHNMGTVATPVRRDVTQILEFDCAADADFGFHLCGGITWVAQGQSRTSGKNVCQTLLTADAAAGATSLTVADDTGWLNTDEIAIASTSQTATQGEANALTGDAGASTLAVSALAVAKKGAAATKTQAEIILLTRNVLIRSVSSTAMACGRVVGTLNNSAVSPSLDWDWVGMRYFGTTSGAANGAISLENLYAVGTVTFDFCVWRDSEHSMFTISTSISSNDGAVAWTDCCMWKLGVGTTVGYGIFFGTSVSVMTFTLTRVTIIGLNAGGAVYGLRVFSTDEKNITATDLRVSCCGNGIVFDGGGNFGMQPWTNNYLHSHSGAGLYFNASGNLNHVFAGDFYSWRNADGIQFQESIPGVCSLIYTGDVYLYGNSFAGVEWTSSDSVDLRFAKYIMCAGDTTFAQPYGLRTSTGKGTELFVERGDFGVATGIFVAHSTADIQPVASSLTFVRWTLRNCVFASGTEVSGVISMALLGAGSYLAYQRYDGTAGLHKTVTPLGTVTIETTTVQDSPGAKLTPTSTTAAGTGSTQRFQSNAGRVGRGFMVGVVNGATVQVSVYVRKDGSYTGSAPRLIQKANAAIGLNADVVLQSLSVGANTWEVLTGTTAAANDDGVIEFVVDCDGAAGNVFVNQWTSGSATPTGDEITWFDGLPYKTAGASIPPSSGGTSRSRVQRGM